MEPIAGRGVRNELEHAWAEMKRNISLANRVNSTDKEVAEFHGELQEALQSAVDRCRLERKRKLTEASKIDLSDECMLRAARFTDNLPLADYAQILHLVPRLVNVVTVRRALQRTVERSEACHSEAHQPQHACLVHKQQKRPQRHCHQNPPYENRNSPGNHAYLLRR
tara:strand:- start:382 stop:882 length:501 start_codon:yes stop_codon:yes gene_type:complete